MRNTVEDKDKLADKLDEDDKATIIDALTEAEDWLNGHDDADREEFDEQLKELQSVCDPIIASIYQQAGGQGGDYDDEEFEDL
jgi:molecular chaperone DnaK (HSP70)